MNRAARRREVLRAQQRLDIERATWDAQVRSLRGQIARHPLAWIVGGGLVSGLAVGLLPLRELAVASRALTSAVSLVLQLPLGALFARPTSEVDTTPADTAS